MGKSRNCSLQANSPFPTVFSQDLYWRHVKFRVRLGKGKVIEFVLDDVENKVGEEENTDSERFLFFQNIYKMFLYQYR